MGSKSKGICAAIVGGVIVLTNNSFGAPAIKVSGFENGNVLYTDCGGDGSTSNISYCLGYIASVADLLSAYEVYGAQTVCISTSGVTAGQLKDVVLKWMRDHPEQRHIQAASLVYEAFREAFPCPE